MKRKIKEAFVYTSVCFAGMMFMLSAAGFDRGSVWPFIICGICGAWIALVAYANGWMKVAE